MDDILKDVINRGTAAHAQGWGFRNVPGKTAFAGKTGTSRDGWFAGFTPDIVCVVYVGFDNGDDLGMKGSDSAMPVWADFMQEALKLHPDWNGDWVMPANIRKGEIDIRNGSLIREVDASTEPTPSPTPSPKKTKDPNVPDYDEYKPPPDPQIYVTEVPPEFRRVELFISGTMPNKSLLPVLDDPAAGSKQTPSPTPLEQTWQDGTEPENGPTPVVRSRNPTSERGTVTVLVCPLTGMRATTNCPDRENRTYRAGTEPKEFCSFHRGKERE
jgi:penicillin-binding protein 1B